MNEIGKKILASITALTIGVVINSVDVSKLKLNEGNTYTGSVAYAEEFTDEELESIRIEDRKVTERLYDEDYSALTPFDEMEYERWSEYEGEDLNILTNYAGHAIYTLAHNEDIDYDLDFVCLNVGKYFSDPASSEVLTYFCDMKNDAMIELFDNHDTAKGMEIAKNLYLKYTLFTNGQPINIGNKEYTVDDINERALIALYRLGIDIVASQTNDMDVINATWDKATELEEAEYERNTGKSLK